MMLFVARQLAPSKRPRRRLWQTCRKTFWTLSWENWWEIRWFCPVLARLSTELQLPDTSWGLLTVFYFVNCPVQCICISVTVE